MQRIRQVLQYSLLLNWTVVGHNINRCPVLGDSMRCEGFGDIENGYALLWDDLCQFGEAISHEDDEVVA